MGKRSLVLAFVSILCMSLLVNGILFLEWNKEKKASVALHGQVAELSADNEQLTKTVAELEGTIEYPQQTETTGDSNWQHSIWWQIAMLRGDSEKEAAFDKMVKENPIDAYFREQKEPVTTVDYNGYYYLYENAWKDEMEEVYGKLLPLVKEPELQKKLTDGQVAFHSSLQANYDFVVAAFSADGVYPMYGTNVWLLRAGLAQSYKERTIELLEWSYILDSSSDFTFNPLEFKRKYDASDLQEQPKQEVMPSQNQPQIQLPILPGEQNGGVNRQRNVTNGNDGGNQAPSSVN
ncbi:MAG: hypothetical protein HFI72_03040 [Peptococcaceae bacterium]|nr:hypothetical protein [Peptococcaceae bacterium]